MYIRSLCNVRRLFSQKIHSQWFYGVSDISHKVFLNQSLTRQDLNVRTSFNKSDQLKSGNEFLQLNSKLASSPTASQVLLDSLKIKRVSNSDGEKWKEMHLDTFNFGHYLHLSKFRLTSLVVLTSMVGYAMAPNPFEIASFLSCVAGTTLVSSAANSVNQFLEVPFDAQMSRTRNRVLVQGHLMPLQVVGFSAVAGCVGLLILYYGANALTAALGASNLILYTIIYTPLKRISILNTWVGSLVGAIPPLMGWAACQGNLDAGAFILGGILYAWQFPHFNALSWNLRPDYSRAGYRMMAITNPDLCRKTAFRYTLGITACSSLAPFFNLTHWSFGVISLPVNLYFIYLGFKFYKESDSKTSRKLFRYSLLHLPLLMGLMLVTKKGLFNSMTNSDVANHQDSLNNHSEDCGVNIKRKCNSSIDQKQSSGSNFSGISLGTTLHAQVR